MSTTSVAGHGRSGITRCQCCDCGDNPSLPSGKMIRSVCSSFFGIDLLLNNFHQPVKIPIPTGYFTTDSNAKLLWQFTDED